MDGWDDLAAGRDARAIAARIIEETTTFNLAALRDDPFGTLVRSTEVTVEIEDGLANTGCGGGGYYRPSPPTIHLHPATSRRDNFTLLHELGHHLQQSHDQWGFALIDMADRERRKVEEQVSDQFAAQILMPVGDADLHDASFHPADVMAGLFARWEASRSAVLQRVREMLPTDSRWLLAVADLDGVVITSARTYDDPQPPKGFAQEGFRRVAAEALESAVRREFHEGIEYKTGAVLDGMRVEAALDHEERYVFIALRPTTVNGSGTWTFPAKECSNPLCEAAFQPNRSSGRCEICQDFKCPDCHRCGCATAALPVACTVCGLIHAGEC
ncbi:ImmA/IrrE family metallo-endopeptidase [Mycobacterium intracellulare]|uniref:ImmA/IrrE family metallo-endopeptidase n=1 Tax=Mycobacterium intracellulare TaxID=1767 RepID=UPI001CD99236|nr:ImmA/IrrE family metallo-endopeptidase [Mycobacterium intracellulare]MCA2308839.1 ImmA/IrrE family metallo-endopeptidase [Mycobacterium intracellulare subsp. chimaera]MCA2352750.1 ImmA/IrrE family metallo-endopeptidase [Mycobacterium intracellulare subsp. chimaera]